MHNLFKLQVVTRDEELYSGDVQKLFVFGTSGRLEVLAHHAPMFTELVSGPIWIIDNKNERTGFLILGGVLEVQPTMSIIIADK